MNNPPPAPPKDKWKVQFVKVRNDGVIVASKTFSCTVEEYGASSAVQRAVDVMIDRMPVPESGYMRVCRVTNLSLVKG